VSDAGGARGHLEHGGGAGEQIAALSGPRGEADLRNESGLAAVEIPAIQRLIDAICAVRCVAGAKTAHAHPGDALGEFAGRPVGREVVEGTETRVTMLANLAGNVARTAESRRAATLMITAVDPYLEPDLTGNLARWCPEPDKS